jgi:hypothetical protein
MADQMMSGGDPDIDFNFARSADVTSSDEHTTGTLLFIVMFPV